MTKYEVKFTSQFKRDLKKAQKQHKDLDKLFGIIEILADGYELDPSYRDHELAGKYKGVRECHVEPDWLLLYEVKHHVLVLMIYRVGSHAAVFNM